MARVAMAAASNEPATRAEVQGINKDSISFSWKPSNPPERRLGANRLCCGDYVTLLHALAGVMHTVVISAWFRPYQRQPGTLRSKSLQASEYPLHQGNVGCGVRGANRAVDRDAARGGQVSQHYSSHAQGDLQQGGELGDRMRSGAQPENRAVFCRRRRVGWATSRRDQRLHRKVDR